MQRLLTGIHFFHDESFHDCTAHHGVSTMTHIQDSLHHLNHLLHLLAIILVLFLQLLFSFHSSLLVQLILHYFVSFDFHLISLPELCPYLHKHQLIPKTIFWLCYQGQCDLPLPLFQSSSLWLYFLSPIPLRRGEKLWWTPSI